MTYALALGCIYRSKGGMALQATISHVSQTLLAVAEVSSGLTSLWLTHALTFVATAAGLSFIPHVKVPPFTNFLLLFAEHKILCQASYVAICFVSFQ